MSRRWSIALVVLASLAVAGPAQAAAEETKPVEGVFADDAPGVGEIPEITVAAPTLRRSYRVIVQQRTRIHRTPGDGATRALLPFIPSTGNDMALLVAGPARRVDGVEWLRVHLPYRPNRSYGWIRADHVEIRENPWRVDVHVDRKLLTVRRAGRIVLRTRVVTGKPATPTPRGRFAVFQKVREPNTSPLGPWALHLTAHSDVLHEYQGGPGRAAIHGMRDELVAPLGASASNGCVRVPNATVTRIAGLIPPGTPVTIR